MKLSLLTIVKIALPTLLLALGINGWTEVHLQHDMKAKTTTLQENVQQAKALSSKLGTSVSGLNNLKSSTIQMQGTLVGVQQSALQMAKGLSTLATTVASINDAVTTTKSEVGTTSSDLQNILQHEQHILTTLNQLNKVNNGIVQNLGQMVSDENTIDANLHQINQKTALIP